MPLSLFPDNPRGQKSDHMDKFEVRAEWNKSPTRSAVTARSFLCQLFGTAEAVPFQKDDKAILQMIMSYDIDANSVLPALQQTLSLHPIRS